MRVFDQRRTPTGLQLAGPEPHFEVVPEVVRKVVAGDRWVVPRKRWVVRGSLGTAGWLHLRAVTNTNDWSESELAQTRKAGFRRWEACE